MEPIRPDDDEVRTGSAGGKPLAAEEKPPAGGKATKDTPGGKRPGASSGGKGGPGEPTGKSAGGGGSGRGWMLGLGLLIVAGAAGAGWYQQEQRIQMLEGQLEEADYWARQSKLALARFEGELSETGESLQEKGQSYDETLSSLEERLDTADSEIGKLWGVANDRNRKRLDEHESQLASLREDLDSSVSEREALASSLEELEGTVSSGLDELESDMEQKIAGVEEIRDENASRLADLEESMANVDERVERQIVRFEREQKLTIDGLESRIAALEEATDDLSSGSQLDEVRKDLAELEETVSSIDSSRAQLTSRLVRLSEEVNDLRSQGSGQ